MSLVALRRSAAVLLLVASGAFPEFSPCSFNFGVDLKQAATKSCNYLGCTKDVSSLNIPSGMDFVAMFVGYTDVGGGQIAPTPESDQEGVFLNWANSLQATPVWYTYIIADGAKQSMGLSDCNQGSNKTLCTDGTSYIRNKRSTILAQYQAYAQFAANKYGTSKPMIWALEPDFYQYASGANGNSSPLSFSDAASLISDIANIITTAMPNAQISMDISPWAPQSWFQALPLSKFKYMNTSGGISQPGRTIANGNDMTWAQVHQWTGLPIIADDGYGTGGTLTNPNSGWTSTSDLNARYADGVIGLMEAYPTSSWTSTISGLRSQLPQSSSCHTISKYTLTVNAGAGGSATATPAGPSFDAGTTVTLKATPQSGYTFSGWSGAASGTSTSTTVVVNGNTTVTAEFSQHILPKYSLTLTQNYGGNIQAAPNGSPFDSGTVVTLTATAQYGYAFQNWSGSVSGTTPTIQLGMNGDKTVSAIFTQSNAILGGPRLDHAVRARLQGNQLQVELDRRGMVEYSLVSIDGKFASNLGRMNMNGQSVTFSLGSIPAGLHLLQVRGEGWQAVVPVAVLAR